MPNKAQVIKISSKRQITIPAKLYQSLGFGENAVCIQVGAGLLLLPQDAAEAASDQAALEAMAKKAVKEQAPPRQAEADASHSGVAADNDASSDSSAPKAESQAVRHPGQADAAKHAASASHESRPRLWDEMATGQGHGSSDQRRRKAVESDKVFQAAATAVNTAAREYPAIERVYLFGAIARGAYDDKSPVDVRIELRPFASFGLHDLMEFGGIVEDATSRHANVISAAVVKNQELAAAIEREKLLVYVRS